MKRQVGRVFAQATRVSSLVLLAALGTAILMRFAPGYFTDGHEFDPEYTEAARARLEAQHGREENILGLTKGIAGGWLHGDLGRSKQYDVPVPELIGPRIGVSAKLLVKGVACGWSVALILALPLAMRRSGKGESAITAASIVLLAVPLGALATVCLLTNFGGPSTVLMALVAVRDFKLAYRLLRRTRLAPHLSYARAQGIARRRILWVHLLPQIAGELLGIGIVSIVLALSVLVPVEVIFDVPGLGHLAWSAAMNRDLPVLLSVTLFMAATVGMLTSASKFHYDEAAL